MRSSAVYVLTAALASSSKTVVPPKRSSACIVMGLVLQFLYLHLKLLHLFYLQLWPSIHPMGSAILQREELQQSLSRSCCPGAPEWGARYWYLEKQDPCEAERGRVAERTSATWALKTRTNGTRRIRNYTARWLIRLWPVPIHLWPVVSHLWLVHPRRWSPLDQRDHQLASV